MSKEEKWERAHYALLKLWTKYTVPRGTDFETTPRIGDLYNKAEWIELETAISNLGRDK